MILYHMFLNVETSFEPDDGYSDKPLIADNAFLCNK